jgi:hypothetical protein
MTRLLVSQHSGFSEYLHTQDGENFALERVDDVQPVLDANKRAQNDNPSGMGASREWKKVASIPVIIQLQWIERYGADPLAKGNEDLLRRVLNDPEWLYLRCSGGLI